MPDELKGVFSITSVVMRVDEASKRLPDREKRTLKKNKKEEKKEFKNSKQLKGKIINIRI